MKNIYFIFLFWFIVNNLIAQQGFIKSYSINNTPTHFNNLILNNDTIIVIGLGLTDTFPYKQGILLSMVDTNGVLLNHKLYVDSLGGDYSLGTTEYILRSIKSQNNSGYLLLGHVFQRNNGILMKVNSDGEQLWIREYADENSLQDVYTELLEISNGFLISGTKQKPSGQIDIVLMKTDKQGNQLWEKSFGSPTRGDYLNSFLKINDNEYILAGHTGPNQDVFNYQQWHYQIQIFAVDSLGNEKWRWESDPPNDPEGEADMSCRGLHRDEQGNWIYMTHRGEHVASSTTGNYQHTKTQAQFVVRDSNFNLVVEREYDDVDGISDGFLNMIHLSDGDWFGVGASRELLPPGGSFPAHIYGWMARVSNGQDGITNLGDSLWTNLNLTFPDSPFVQLNYLHSAVELPSGSLIAAGYFTNFNPGQSDHGLLIKINQHGCLDWDNCTPTNFPNISLTSSPAYQPDLKVFPNPTHHQLHILSDAVPVWDKVEVLDMTGQVVRTVFNNNELTLEGVPSGMYVLRLWKGEQFWTRKIIVE